MENKIPPLPPKRPFPQRVINNSNNVIDNKNVNLENDNKKEKFKLNSQTKAFIIFFASFFCIAGAITCFVFMFL